MATTPASQSNTDVARLRPTGVFWLVLATSLLLFAGYFSYASPTGHWRNQVFGEELWFENDPGGNYVGSAHELFADQGPLFAGHPGTTLQLLLSLLQHAYYWIAGDDRFTFTEFTARHIHRVFFFSKMLVASLHLLDLFLVYRLARTLLQRERAAVAAVLGYATCLPFLYYLSRVSVEPLLVLFFVTTVLSLSACHRRLEEGNTRGALVSAGLAGALAVSGSFTKLNLLAPLPFFGVAYLLARGGFGSASRIPLSHRFPSLLAFALTALLAGLLYSQLVDWGHFWALWREYVGVESSHAWSLTSLLPAATGDGLFLLCELAFITLGAVGWVVLLRRPSPGRADCAWLSLYSCWVLVLWIYRVSSLGNLRPFHYLFPVMVLGAACFGIVTDGMLERSRWSRRDQWFALVLWVGFVHLPVFWAVVDSRTADVAEYRPLRQVHEVLGALEPGQRITSLDGPWGGRLRFVHGLSPRFAPAGRKSRLITEFREIFVFAPPSSVVERMPIYHSSALGSFAVIGHPSTSEPR